MVARYSLAPPQLVEDVFGADSVPVILVEELTARFHETKEDGSSLGTEVCSGRSLHAFLGHFVSNGVPIPGFSLLLLLYVDQDGAVHLLHSLLSVPVRSHSVTRQIVAPDGELPESGLPPVIKFTAEAFVVWPAISSVLQDNHVSHLGGFTPLKWLMMDFEWADKRVVGEGGLTCLVLNF